MPDTVLLNLLACWEERALLGDPVSPEELCRDCPEFLTELRERIDSRLNAKQTIGGETSSVDEPFSTTLGPPFDAPGVPLAPPGYEIEAELGRGGMGVVYRARQTSLDRAVGLKMILVGEHAGRVAVERFVNEAKAAARLQHPNIVQVFEIGRWQPPGGAELPFFSMEYCAGGSLAERLRSAWAPEDAAQLVATLARAIHLAHQVGIIHRDLKPANVLLTADGTPKIADFGLAKRAGFVSLTGNNAIMGSPGYMAPEQAAGDSRRVGPQADVYGLGAILYHLLTGKAPFRGNNALDVLIKVAQVLPIPPREVNPAVPELYEAICMACLSKKPEDRPASAEALSRQLLQLDPVPTPQVTPSSPVTRPGAGQTRPRWFARHPFYSLASLAFAGVVLLAALTWHLLSPVPRDLVRCIALADGLQTADDLSLPLNVSGHQDASAFLTWANADRLSDRPWRSTEDRHEPWPIESDTRFWRSPIERNRASSRVIYISQPGGADENGDAFFFDNRGGRLKVSIILESLTESTTQQNKTLLILDATQSPTDWWSGMLSNNFAAGVKKLGPELANQPNLLVFCSSSPGERSWASDELGQSVFGHFLLRGLKGAAAKDGSNRIYADGLANYVSAEVERWVETHREGFNGRTYTQRPFLLSANGGSAGQFLVGYRDSAKVDDDLPRSKPVRANELTSAWERCEQLAAVEPKPWVYTPQLWRRYRELLLRHERLLRAGQDEAAAKLRVNIDSMASQIDAARQVNNFAALTASLSMPAAMGRDAVVDKDQLAELYSHPPAKQQALLDELKSLAPGAELAVPMLKLVGHMLDVAAQDPAKFNLDLLARIDAAGVNRPMEAHLAVMLLKHQVPGWKRPPPQLWALAIDTRRRAEQASLSINARRKHPYSERLPKPLQDQVATADRERRRGEDLLFAGPASQADVQQKLEAAKSQYEAVRKLTETIRRSYEVRDLVMADLPYLTEWVGRPLPLDAPIEKRVAAVEKLWSDAHELADWLVTLDPLSENPPKVIEFTRPSSSRSLPELAEEVSLGYDALVKSYRDFARAQLAAGDQPRPSAHAAAEALLAVPGPLLSAGDRLGLINLLRRDPEILSAGGDRPPVDEAETAKHQARLARAMLGRSVINFNADSSLGRFEELLDDASPKLAAQLAGHWRKLNDLPSRRLERLPRPEDRLPWLERLSLTAVAARGPSPEPAFLAKNTRWNATFRRLAQRAELDHWYDEKPVPRPYYESLAVKFLIGLPPDECDDLIKKLRERRQSGQLRVDSPADHLLTVERELSLQFEVRTLDSRFDPGFAVLLPRLSNAAALNFPRPVAAQAASLAVTTVERVPLAVERHGHQADKLPDARLTLSAFYRGQVAAGAATIMHQADPDLTVTRPKAVPGAQLAVRADDDLDLGFVTIIFDCSGSMNDGTKFADAKSALRRFQGTIPAGTKVALYAYGHHRDGGRWEETGDRLLFVPSWDPSKPDLLSRAVDPLAAHGYTPLLDTMFKAVREPDFQNARGAKTLLILTDGCDNRDGRMPTKEHIKEVAERFRGEFVTVNRGTSIQMMLFQLDKAESDIADQQFPDADFQEIGQSSRKWRVGSAAELATALTDSVRPRVELFKDGAKTLERVASRHGEPLDWTPLATTGEYELRVRGLTSKVILNDGDRLGLRLSRGPGGVQVSRLLQSDEMWASDVVPLDGAKKSSGISVGYNKNSLVYFGDSIRAQLILDDRAAASAVNDPLRVDRPRFTWWELHPAGRPLPSHSRVSILPWRPAPAWELSCGRWPASNNGRPLPASVDVWVGDADHLHPLEVRPGKSPVTNVNFDGEVVIESAAFESAPSPDSAGRFYMTECLVVRVHSPKGRRYVATTVPEAVSEQHCFYFDANRSTSTFLMPRGAEKSAVSLRLISIDDFKAKSTRLQWGLPQP